MWSSKQIQYNTTQYMGRERNKEKKKLKSAFEGVPDARTQKKKRYGECRTTPTTKLQSVILKGAVVLSRVFFF